MQYFDFILWKKSRCLAYQKKLLHFYYFTFSPNSIAIMQYYRILLNICNYWIFAIIEYLQLLHFYCNRNSIVQTLGTQIHICQSTIQISMVQKKMKLLLNNLSFQNLTMLNQNFMMNFLIGRKMTQDFLNWTKKSTRTKTIDTTK